MHIYCTRLLTIYLCVQLPLIMISTRALKAVATSFVSLQETHAVLMVCQIIKGLPRVTAVIQMTIIGNNGDHCCHMVHVATLRI